MRENMKYQIPQHQIELEHIQLEIKYQRFAHLRSLVDQWFCHKFDYVTKTGKASWNKITFNELVSEAAIGKSRKEIIRKEHIVPLKVITEKLKQLPHDASLEQIEQILSENVIFATITREEDAQLRSAKLNHAMPKEYYDPQSELYMDPFARYKKIGLEVKKIEEYAG